MDSYTITITPNDDSGNSTTLTVDTTTGQARITSVHLHAPAGLTSGQIPSVDVSLLLQAVTGPTTTPAAITATPTPAPEAAPHPSPTDTEEPSASAATTTPEAVTANPTPHASATAPAKRAGRRPAVTRAAENDKPLPSGTRRRNQPATTKPAPSKTTSKRATAAAAAPAAKSTERAYRKMPDDFAAVYRQAGTTAAIADHYGVPRHTAQGWVSRHKKQEAAGNK